MGTRHRVRDGREQREVVARSACRRGPSSSAGSRPRRSARASPAHSTASIAGAARPLRMTDFPAASRTAARPRRRPPARCTGAPKRSRQLGDERGALDRRGVDGRPCRRRPRAARARVVERAHAAADGRAGSTATARTARTVSSARRPPSRRRRDVEHARARRRPAPRSAAAQLDRIDPRRAGSAKRTPLTTRPSRTSRHGMMRRVSIAAPPAARSQPPAQQVDAPCARRARGGTGTPAPRRARARRRTARRARRARRASRRARRSAR